MVEVKRALISVSDKRGVDVLAKSLHSLGVEIISTGGTSRTITKLGIPVKEISEYTNFPEMMGGRVKTLHPKIHGGLLALRGNPEHLKQAEENGIGFIDMVVVNLYPFEEVIKSENTGLDKVVENIDIGGPAMLRSAAKNYKSVAVVTDPSQYSEVIRELEENKSCLSDETLEKLALKAFQKTAEYDSVIYDYLSKRIAGGKPEGFPEKIHLNYTKLKDLRYGENPHQKAAFYSGKNALFLSISQAKKLQGKELSYNNIVDFDSALMIVSSFKRPAAVIIKHSNPCGAAVGKDITDAFVNAWEGDSLSAFGGIIGLNSMVGRDTALAVSKAGFIEGVIAPEFEPEALEILTRKKNLRVIETGRKRSGVNEKIEFKRVSGGLVVQDFDRYTEEDKSLKIVTEKKLDEKDMPDLLFAWKVCRYVKSNAVVLARGEKTVGIGAGQMSRVDSVIIACRKAGDRARGAVLASDAFFPKADSIEYASKAGIKAVIQPGGSIRDKEVIDACNRLGIAMVFTGIRHFRH